MKAKIMIVDDDATSLAIAKAILEEEFEVITAGSGISALGYLKGGEHLDLILLDMIMPGTSGMDVLKTLKQTPELSQIPVVFLTSMEGIDFELEGFINGAEDFLQKPVHAGLMKMKIKRQLYIHRLKEENQFLQQKLQTVRNEIDRIFEEVM